MVFLLLRVKLELCFFLVDLVGLRVAQRKVLDRVIFLMPPLFVNEMGYVTQYE
jgi:hypothetical protein